MIREDIKLDYANTNNISSGPFSLAASNISLNSNSIAANPRQQHKQMNVLQENNAMPLRHKLSSMDDDGMRKFEHKSKEMNSDQSSTIAILRRHPMYDCLLLAKKPTADGYVLELPTSHVTNNCCIWQETTEGNEQNELRKQSKQLGSCRKSKLVTVYLDGDDPIYQREQETYRKNETRDRECEIVHVPMNGLLDRLNNYEKQGIAIDGRIYAFAMGLKTAEKFLTSNSVREIQETPPM